MILTTVGFRQRALLEVIILNHREKKETRRIHTYSIYGLIHITGLAKIQQFLKRSYQKNISEVVLVIQIQLLQGI